MSGYRNRTLQRVDGTAKALIEEAQSLGAQYLGINGVIDGVLFFGGKTLLVDWKSAKTPLTKAQRRLVDTGWPINFVRTKDELYAALRVRVGDGATTTTIVTGGTNNGRTR